MYRPSKRIVVAVLLLGAVLGSFGVWVLLHPASIFVQPWRAERAASPVDGVMVGPYPVEQDFIELKKRGVTTIISLLEPNVPYEKVLLDQERERAGRYGMTVKNFPMGSILGQKFGDAYKTNSKAAAQAAIDAPGVAYIHCYLGVHRAVNVQKYLTEHAKANTEVYAGANATSRADLAAETEAKQAFRAEDYGKSLAILAKITRKTPRVLRVEAWNYYRLKRIAEARGTFDRVLGLVPGDADARMGLAYCNLFENKLDAADQGFGGVLDEMPDEVFALEGMGYVRYRQGRWDEARKLFSRVIELNPENDEVIEMLERIDRAGTSAQAAAETKKGDESWIS